MNLTKKSIYIIFLIAVSVLVLAVIFRYLINSKEIISQTYLYQVTKLAESQIIDCNVSIIDRDYNSNKDITYRTILKKDFRYNYFIEFVKSIKSLRKLDNQNEKEYIKIIYAIIETNRGITKLEVRLKPEDFSIYLPEINAYYMTTEESKKFLHNMIDVEK